MAGTFDDRYNKSENATRFIKHRVSDISPSLEGDDDSSTKRTLPVKPALLTSVLAGGFAGVVVDMTLFPIDTVKTRLQSEIGFRASGGFKGIYKGVIPVVLTSAPLSALFFATYNTMINTIRTQNANLNPFVYFAAATASEIICAAARVPLEVLKQRQQISHKKAFVIIKAVYNNEGYRGFYRGFKSTLMREIPFAAIQYPLWEYFLSQLTIYEGVTVLNALESAYCGALAGAIAAGLTTPMDVIKTRVMLAEREKIKKYEKRLLTNFAKEIYRNSGISGFFAGAIPRILWITLGGFLYFGAYEKAKIIYESDWCKKKTENKDEHRSSSANFEEIVMNSPVVVDSMCKIQTKLKSIVKLDKFLRQRGVSVDKTLNSNEDEEKLKDTFLVEDDDLHDTTNNMSDDSNNPNS